MSNSSQVFAVWHAILA